MSTVMVSNPGEYILPFENNSSIFAHKNSKKSTANFLLAAPTSLFISDFSFIDDESDVDRFSLPTPNLSQSAPAITQSSLKASFDAFFQSIEPIVIDSSLNVGVSSVPHPAKIAKGGEDAYFLSGDMRAIGVADGVGGWADIGVDPAEYSRKLMEEGKVSAEASTFQRDPVRIMCEAYNAALRVQGSSTACIITLDGLRLNAANLGDSGFMVLRGTQIIYRTKEQQHSFNFPYQIGTGSADRPEHAQRITIEVQPGDLIILGTDGLWDNLFDEDIVELVLQSYSDPASIAQVISHQAHLIANNKDILSPFSKSARSNGYPLASGGKLDDITVLVGRVTINSPSFSDDTVYVSEETVIAA